MSFTIYRHSTETGWKLDSINFHDIQQAISVYRSLDSNLAKDETLVLISTESDHLQLWFQHGPEKSLPTNRLSVTT